MNDLTPRHERKTVVINRRFQFRIVAMILLAGILCIGITANLCYAYLVENYDLMLRKTDMPQAMVDQQYRDLFTFLAALSAVNFVIVVVVAIWALFVTNRTAGALYHLKRVMDAVASGNAAARVHLREKDDFHELAAAFNAMLDAQQQKGRV